MVDTKKRENTMKILKEMCHTNKRMFQVVLLLFTWFCCLLSAYGELANPKNSTSISSSSPSESAAPPKSIPNISSHPIIIIISFDGFRYDYFKRINATNMDYLSSSGVTVPYMRNQFITKTFPNHQSIVTGLHVESHGVVDNWLFDPKFNKTMGENDGELYWNFSDDILPLWTVNDLAGGGRKSGSMMWPGSNHPYGKNKTLPSKFVPWNDTVDWKWRVDTVMDWLTDPVEPVNLAFMYFEEPDEFAHSFGSESMEVTRQIERVDNLTGYLIQKLQALGIFDHVNLILLSDHGFYEVHQRNIINYTSIVSPSLYDRYGSSPVIQLNPKDGELDTVYDAFKEASLKNGNFSVYRKGDLHDDWNYKHNRRIMPIVLVAELGYVFEDFYTSIVEYNRRFNLTANSSRVYGVHGYDNHVMPMHPFFLAHGPLFESGQTEPFENVDLFPLICFLLNIPAPPNNGTLSHIKFIKLRKGFTFQSPVGWAIGAAVIVGLTILFGIMSMVIVKHRNGASSILAENGYRYVSKEEFVEILEDDSDKELSFTDLTSDFGLGLAHGYGYGSGSAGSGPDILIVTGDNNKPIPKSYGENRSSDIFENGDADEIQALLLSSSNEEL